MKFENKNIAVIGDIMLDKYIFGKVDRISPEAPVPIILVKKEEFVPGGAANAACNIATLKGNAFLFGIVGSDASKDILIDVSHKSAINTEGVIIDGKRPTIQKIRVLGHNQQLLRIDYEDNNYISTDLEKQIIDKISLIDNLHVIIISDYQKGTITKKLVEELKKYAKAKNIKLIVDPKPKHKSFYKNVSLITPNKKEAEEMTGIIIETKEDIEIVGEKLISDLNCDVLITTGEKGMSLFQKDVPPVHIPTVAKEVYDVSGAGDTVIATLSLALSSGYSLKDSAILANHAAGIKVGKLGTAPVSLDELKKSIEDE